MNHRQILFILLAIGLTLSQAAPTSDDTDDIQLEGEKDEEINNSNTKVASTLTEEDTSEIPKESEGAQPADTPTPSTTTDAVITESPSKIETASTKPPTTETASTKPPTTETASTKPSTTETASTKPPTTETASTKPSTTETASTKPPTTETASTKPPTTEPASTKPSTTGPPVVTGNITIPFPDPTLGPVTTVPPGPVTTVPPSPASTVPPAAKPIKNGLGGGAIAGIVLGVMAVIVVFGAIYYFYSSKKLGSS